MSKISDKAVISPNAKIGNNVTIYPFVYIEDDVVIGDDCVIYPNVSIMNGARIGKNNKIHQNSVISCIPQDFHYKGDATVCVIGEGNIIRENVVINRASFKDGETRIGDGNFIMEGVHISHDVHMGNENVLGYGTKIAGEVEIGNDTIFSSSVIVNPNCRIGDCAMIQSGSRFSKDVPPYIVAGGSPIAYGGVNSYTVREMGISDKVKGHIANAYRLVFHGQNDIHDVCRQIKQQVPESPEIDNIVDFLTTSKLGLITKL